MSMKTVGVAVAALAFSSAALAGGPEHAPKAPVAQNDFYVAASGGYAINFRNKTVLTSQTRRSPNTYAFRLAAGYNLNENAAVELGVGTYGRSSYNFLNAATTQIHRVRSRFGVDANVVGKMAISDGPVYVFAKAGAILLNLHQDSNQKGAATNVGTHWRFAPQAEAGLGYNITDHASVTVSYRHIFGRGQIGKKTYVPSMGIPMVGINWTL